MQTDSFLKHYRWLLLILLWLLYTAFGLVSRAIFPLVTPILEDLHLSYSQMGFILGSWQLTYVPVALIAGTLLDRWGLRRSIFAGAMVIGISASIRYFADGFSTMLLAVALFGVGGPMISIGGPKAISGRFSAQHRGIAVGIYMTGPWIGGLMALALTNSLVMPLVGNSWRLSFACYGLATFAVAFLWWFLVQADAEKLDAAGAGIMAVFRKLMGIRNVQLLMVMALFSFAVIHGISSWLPKIFEESGMSASRAGFVAAIPVAAGILSLMIIPPLVPSRLRSRVVAIFALSTTLILLMVMKTSGAMLYLELVVLGIIISPFVPLMLLILMETSEVKPSFMGAAGGMFFCVAEIGGSTGPLLMGILVDITGSFMAGALFLAGLCIAIAVLTVLLK